MGIHSAPKVSACSERDLNSMSKTVDYDISIFMCVCQIIMFIYVIYVKCKNQSYFKISTKWKVQKYPFIYADINTVCRKLSAEIVIRQRTKMYILLIIFMNIKTYTLKNGG